MTATFRDVETAVDAWKLRLHVTANDLQGRAELIIDGKATRYPYWLAVRKLNQLGVECLP